MSAHPAPRATRAIRAETAGSSGLALGPNQRGKRGGELEASIPVMAMAHQRTRGRVRLAAAARPAEVHFSGQVGLRSGRVCSYAGEPVCTDVQCDDGGVVGGDDVGIWKGPAGCVPAGPWCSCWRVGGQSAVTSAAAALALVSSTMALRVAQAAMRAWMARLLTALGRPRLVAWIRAVASSLNS